MYSVESGDCVSMTCFPRFVIFVSIFIFLTLSLLISTNHWGLINIYQMRCRPQGFGMDGNNSIITNGNNKSSSFLEVHDGRWKPITVEKLKKFKPNMSQKERAEMLGLMKTFKKLMDNIKVPFFMYGGSLIGSYRHHGFIPWDDDIDLFIPNKHRKKLDSAMAAFPDQGLVYDGPRTKFFNKKGQPSKGKAFKYPFLDLCFYNEDNNHLWDIDPYFKRTGYIFKREMVFPLVSRPFADIMLPAPSDTEGFLKKTYGDINSKCTSSRLNHRVGAGILKKEDHVACKELYKYFPFVFRQSESFAGVNETLQMDGETLSWWHNINKKC